MLSAPFEPDGWDKALKLLARHTRSGCGELVAFGDRHSVPFNWITDSSQQTHDDFLAIGGGRPDVNWRVACAAGPFEITSERHYDIAQKRLRSEAYDDWVERYGMVHGCQTVLSNGGGVMLGLAVGRPRSEGRTTEEDRKAFSEVAPFVLAAVQLQRTLHHRGSDLLQGALDGMPGATMMLDRQRQVVSISDAAWNLLRADRRVLIRDGRVAATAANDERALQHALNKALDPAAIGTAATTRIFLSGHGGLWDMLIAEVYPLPRRDWDFDFEPRALVAFKRAGACPGAHGESLTRILGLTRAEAEVAVLLANGASREEIAIERGTSLQTVNTQLKSLYRKADVNREGQLIALLNLLLR